MSDFILKIHQLAERAGMSQDVKDEFLRFSMDNCDRIHEPVQSNPLMVSAIRLLRIRHLYCEYLHVMKTPIDGCTDVD